MSPFLNIWILFAILSSAGDNGKGISTVVQLTEPQCVMLLDRLTDTKRSFNSYCVNQITGERLIYRIRDARWQLTREKYNQK